jgi:cobalt/nickel transport system permease protein
VDEVERVTLARDARLYGNRWIWHARVIGYMVGSIFVRSFERGERIFRAMKARGYDAEMIRTKTRPLVGADLVFMFVVIICAALIRAAGGLL